MAAVYMMTGQLLRNGLRVSCYSTDYVNCPSLKEEIYNYIIGIYYHLNDYVICFIYLDFPTLFNKKSYAMHEIINCATRCIVCTFFTAYNYILVIIIS